MSNALQSGPTKRSLFYGRALLRFAPLRDISGVLTKSIGASERPPPHPPPLPPPRSHTLSHPTVLIPGSLEFGNQHGGRVPRSIYRNKFVATRIAWRMSNGVARCTASPCAVKFFKIASYDAVRSIASYHAADIRPDLMTSADYDSGPLVSPGPRPAWSS